MDGKLLEGFKNPKEKVNRCHYFPCQQWPDVLAPQVSAVQSLCLLELALHRKIHIVSSDRACWSRHQTGASKSLHRYVSQPVLKKWLFYSYRIQDRADVPDVHLIAALLHRPCTADQHQGAGALLPSLRMEVSTPGHFTRQKGQPDPEEYENIQLHSAMHRGLSFSHCSRQGDPHSPKLSYSCIQWPPCSISSLFGEVAGDYRHN